MQRTKREHANNLALALLNLVALLIAGFLLEFEIARLQRPDVGWPDTPSGVDYAVAGAMALASLVVLAILILIYKKGLYNRPYLWWITGFNIIIGFGLLVYVTKDIGLWTLINFVLFP